jgi:diguanylate cyclase (GGDEF)-like protein/PAS domain S-box-containing protein
MLKEQSEPAVENSVDSAVYKTLLESTKAIPWKIDWATTKFSYIGPQIEQLLGWSTSSWGDVNDWAARMHPEDRDFAVNFCVSQSSEGIDHEVDYRALTKDGKYVWMRDVVHVVRDEQGKVKSLIGFMFDISERKKNEEELARLYKRLETRALTDYLTGVANRHQFSLKLDTEWARARRSHEPLSLVLLDIDFFKQYNDYYGHVQGDECLQRVGQALGAAPMRSTDLVARYGGEEFVLLLPNTDNAAAQIVAEKCRKLIESLQIYHAESSVSSVVTVSLGVGTIVPTMDGSPLAFIDNVDKFLYLAKQRGRNRAEFAPSKA